MATFPGARGLVRPDPPGFRDRYFSGHPEIPQRRVTAKMRRRVGPVAYIPVGKRTGLLGQLTK